MAAGTEAVEVILMGTMIIPEAIPATTPAMITPKATPTGMKTLGLDVDCFEFKAPHSVEVVCETSVLGFSSLGAERSPSTQKFYRLNLDKPCV